MSDRFYQQQCEFFNVSPSAIMVMERFPDLPESKKLKQKLSGEKAKTTRVLKKDVISEIFDIMGTKVTFNGLDALSMEKLKQLKSAIATGWNEEVIESAEMPTGRTKDKYISLINRILETNIDLKALKLTTLKSIIWMYGIE